MSDRSDLGGLDALRHSVESIGLRLNEHTHADDGVDVVLEDPSGARIAVAVKRVSLASSDGLARRLREWNTGLPNAGVIGLVVADRVTSGARDLLRQAGWGWLDLRGHLHMAGPGLFVDADVPALTRTTGRSTPIAGRVSIEVSALLLLNPDTPAVVRRLAAELGRAPSSVSEVITRLRAGGVLDDQRRPVLPDLFWQLADHWRPAGMDISSAPGPGEGTVTTALRLGLDTAGEGVGWALTDTVAAAVYGAPLGVRSDHPREFYVPDQSTFRRAIQLLGPVSDHARRAATIRIAPVPLVCSLRVNASTWANEEWPLAQPLFVALDLAQDPGRGREILDGWTPPEPWHRVW